MCAMRHTSDLKTLIDDEASTERRRRSTREASIELMAVASSFRASYSKMQTLHVITLRTNRVGEKLFMDYNMSSPFA